MQQMDRYNKYTFDSDYARAANGLTLNQYVARSFLWMFIGLMVTFGTAYLGYMTGALIFVFFVPIMPVALVVAELAVVLVLSARIHKLKVGTARVLFLLYAVLNGVVFSTYFLIFEMSVLIYIFALTAAFFGIFALYGRFTKRDLSGFGPYIVGGLIFLLVAGIVSMLLPLGGLERVISLFGIALFLGITAYDSQKIGRYYVAYQDDSAMLQRASIFSALQLYLDFINLFLYLLRFFARSRSN